MKLTERRLRQSGFTLVEVMISSAILGVVALMIASVTSSVQQWQQTVIDRDEAAMFSASVGKLLRSNGLCTTSLLNTVVPPAGAPAPFTLNNYNGYGFSGASPISSGTSVGSKTRVSNLTIVDKGIAPATIKVAGTSLLQLMATITMNLQSKTGTTYRDLAPVYFDIAVAVDPGTRQIKSCLTDATLDQACLILGSTFNPLTGVCNPTTQCFFEGAYTTATCTPGGYGCAVPINNPLTSAQSCPAGATASQTGESISTFTASCGKKCTVTVTQVIRFFICMKCT